MLPAPYPILRSPDERYAMREDLLGLARDGVYLAPIVTNRAVRSYRTLSPFPVPPEKPSGVCFLWHFPSFPAARVGSGVGTGGCYPPSCPVVLGLSSHGWGPFMSSRLAASC